MKLNLGCGRFPMPGYVNVDCVQLPGVDIVMTLDCPTPLVFPPEVQGVTEVVMNHVIEHIHQTLNLMEALWKVVVPDATVTIRCPYGSSDDADEDPTHVRRYFAGSWGYFSQPYYWRADYGYRGDWAPLEVRLRLAPQYKGRPQRELWSLLYSTRNVVSEQEVILSAIKPARPPVKSLQRCPILVFTE